MVAGGKPAQHRAVVTVSVAGVVLSAAIGVHTCCTPIVPPNIPEVPIVDAAPIEPKPEASIDAPTCVFTSPRTRGVRPKDPRIVGGQPAPFNAYPFAAAISTSSGHQYCGGSVIGARFVLTAAHCQVQAGDRVLVGNNDLRFATSIPIAESRIHPSFDPNSLDYDAAIAVLAEPTNVPLVSIATSVSTLDATVVGWGATCEGCATTSFLREVSVPLWERCDSAYEGLTDRQLCAGYQLGGKDSCQGDSGSSLLTWNIDRWEQLGIVSWGAGCARPDSPGVYSDLRNPELRTWVEACSK